MSVLLDSDFPGCLRIGKVHRLCESTVQRPEQSAMFKVKSFILFSGFLGHHSAIRDHGYPPVTISFFDTPSGHQHTLFTFKDAGCFPKDVPRVLTFIRFPRYPLFHTKRFDLLFYTFQFGIKGIKGIERATHR